MLTDSITDETTRAQNAEGVLSDSITDETTRAQNAEGVLTDSITDETTRAQNAEGVLTDSITDETTRAQNAEGALQTIIDNWEAINIVDIKDLEDSTGILSTISTNISTNSDNIILNDVDIDLNRNDINRNRKSIIKHNRDIMTNSVEIRMLKERNLNEDLSFMIDTFVDDEELDALSANYEVIDGHVGLTQRTSLIKIESTKSEFDNGTYTNSETVTFAGGVDAIIKGRTIVGEVLVIPNFPTGASVKVDNIEQEVSIKEGTFIEGSESSQLKIEFPLPIDGSKDIFINLNRDLSSYKTVELFYKRTDDTKLTYQAAIVDNSLTNYWYGTNDFQAGSGFKSIKLDLDLARNNGVNLADLQYIQIQLSYLANEQEIINLFQPKNNDNFDIYAGKWCCQTFILTEDSIAQMVKIRVRRRNNTSNNLNVALANTFGITIAVGIIEFSEADTVFDDFYVLLDNPVSMKKDFEYRLLLQADSCERDDRWEVNVTAYDQFPQFTTFVNKVNTSHRSIACTIYKPPVSEDVYLDNITLAKTSLYNSNCSFLSQVIDLGSVPDSIDEMIYERSVDGNDTIEIRVRSGNNASDILTNTWGAWQSSLLFNSLVSILPRRFIQYEVRWTGGTTDSSTSFKNIEITYSTPAGEGVALIISTLEQTIEIPETFMCIWDVELNTGSMDLYISRDGMNTWQTVTPDQENKFINFTDALPGKDIYLKAELRGDARLYSWGLATEEEFI